MVNLWKYWAKSYLEQSDYTLEKIDVEEDDDGNEDKLDNFESDKNSTIVQIMGTQSPIDAEESVEEREIIELTHKEVDTLDLFNYTYYTRPIALWDYKCNTYNHTRIDHAFSYMVEAVGRNDRLLFK